MSFYCVSVCLLLVEMPQLITAAKNWEELPHYYLKELARRAGIPMNSKKGPQMKELRKHPVLLGKTESEWCAVWTANGGSWGSSLPEPLPEPEKG